MNFCTNCGQPVSPDAHFCSNCGFKLSHEAITDTSRKVKSEIDNLVALLNSTTDDEQKASYVRNVVIPDSREDILDLMLLASSNVSGVKSLELFDAWRSLFEACYQKAFLLYASEHGFVKIQRLYDSVKFSINNEKFDHSARNIAKKTLSVIWNIVFIAVFLYTNLFLILSMSDGMLSPSFLIALDIIVLGTYVAVRTARKKKS